MALKFNQAKAITLKNIKPLGVENVPLAQCLGREPMGKIRAPYDYPLRDVSAMDGFAYRFADLKQGKGLHLVGERAAGDSAGKKLKKGQAARIMTGGPVPPGADTVTIQEKAMVEGGTVVMMEKPTKGQNVRKQGEGTRRGEKITLPEGPLTARTLGFLASLGAGSLYVKAKPKVKILVTGAELVRPGDKPGESGVFESNGLMLSAALREAGIKAEAHRVGDEENLLTGWVQKALVDCDILLVTGGVSVGDHDPTKKAFHKAGVKRIFWCVLQKPGGPLFFGRKGKTAVFGLPGNPAAVYSCFQLYVRPLLQKLQGCSIPLPLKVRLSHSFQPLKKKILFAKAKWENKKNKKTVKVLGGQGSHLLESLARGDGLLEISPGSKPLKKGAILSFYPFREGS